MGNSESSSSQFPLGKHNGADEEEDDVSFLQICAAVAWTALLAFGASKLSTSSSSELSTSTSSSSDDDLEEREALYQRRWVGSYVPESATSYESRRGGGRSAYSETFGTIKIMSYNVWCIKIEIRERMKSISSLILKHSPDVIFFQEITPEIYSIFESSEWWYLYECSVSQEEMRNRNYFPMMLSKLPAEFLNSKQLKKVIGKEIIVAKIDPGLQEELYVATIHLKSPAFPQMHREERTAQAEKAINLLNPLPNIVFGGDMNWDDDSDGDGPFPLLDGWVDAWTELRDDDEHGWTFDTRANPMLEGYKPLQKRLDRFMCKLRDFRLYNVEMIGLEAIPDFNSRNIEGTLLTGLEAIPDLHARNIKGKMAPVLSSDHFGLILTICPKDLSFYM